MSKLLICHQLARLLSELPLKMYNLQDTDNYTEFILNGVTVRLLSWSSNSVSCVYAGSKYNFTYVFKKNKINYVREYFRDTLHYLNIDEEKL